MTTYVYCCTECDVDREEVHGMMESPEFSCNICNTPLTKVIRSVSFQLKGNGWFNSPSKE